MPLSSLLETDLGIHAQGEGQLPTVEPVLVAPRLSAIWFNQQIQTPTVTELALTFSRLRLCDLGAR